MQIDDFKVEQIIGQLLRAGVLLAAAVVVLGGALYLRQSSSATASYQTFRGEPVALKTISGVVHGAFSGEPQAVIQLGLLLLIATPIARVLFSVGAFALERDWLYVGLTLVVLGVLLFSVMQSS